MKRLRPFFSYYGSRWRLAPSYPKPEYNAIVEPFAGSAGYSLLYPDSQIYLCDKSEAVCGAWDYLIKAPEREILSLPDVTTCITEDFKNAPPEAKWLAGFWMWRASPHWCDSIRKNVPSNQQGMYWSSIVRERIASQQRFIRHWKIKQCCYSEIPNDRATWFVDAPFVDKGAFYQPHSSKQLDYAKLAEWCRSREGQVVVCEGQGADWLPFMPFKTASGKMVKPGVEHAPHKDVIWENRS